MSDRMLEVCSTLVLILVAFSIALMVTGWMQTFLKLSQTLWDAILMVGGSGTSILGLRVKSYLDSRDSSW